MNMTSPIPVIIPVYGRDDVFSTVEMLRTQKYAACLRFVVVDNGNGPERSVRLAGLAGDDCQVVRFDENRGGSAALDLCNIACGTYDGYWEYCLNLYDVAAGVLIAKEAGAVIHDYFGGEEYPEKGLLASNPALMPQFLEYTKNF